MTIGRKMSLGFGVLLALMTALAVVVLVRLDSIQRQFSFVIQHDVPIIANARQLLTLVVDMETGQRGFVITGTDEFLEPYDRARVSISDLLDKQKQLVSDSPSQVKLLEEIEVLVQEWQEKAAVSEIAMRRKVVAAGVDAQHLQEILSQGVGKRLMDKFMAMGHEIEVSFRDRKDWEGAYVVEIIEKCMADREAGQRGFLITGREDFLEKYVAGEQEKLPHYFYRLRSIISDRGLTEELSETIDQWKALSVEWSRQAAEPEIAARRVMNKHPESLKDVSILLEEGSGKRIHDQIRGKFKTFIAEAERTQVQRFANASQVSTSAIHSTIVLALISVVVGGGVALLITRGITKPVHQLANALGRVAKGDLSQSIAIKSNDEIGALSSSFNRMVDDLKRLEWSREQDEQALRAAKDYANNIIESMNDMLLVIAPGDRIVTANHTACSLLGYREEELVGQPISLLFHEESPLQDSPTSQTLSKSTVLRHLRRDGAISNMEELLRSKNGDTIPVLISGAVMRGNDSQISGIVCVAHDITERKQSEAALVKSLAAVESAKLADRTKSEFMANMSHEIRTPLNAILGFARRLFRSPLAEQEKKQTGYIVEAGEMLLVLINQVLDISKIEAGKIELHIKEIDLYALINDSVAMIRSLADEKQLIVNSQIDASVPRKVRGDVVQLRHVLVNLLGNAVKFTEFGGIDLRAQLEQQSEETLTVRIEVSDTGIGIPSDRFETIFGAFVQVDSSTTREQNGTGLGLSIARQLARLMGGDILVQSTLGEGSIFSFTVELGKLTAGFDQPDIITSEQPAKEAEEIVNLETTIDHDDQALPSESGGAESLEGGPIRVLCAEDIRLNQLLISELLEEADIQVEMASNGHEALALLKKGPAYDLMLMDIQMPGINGFETARRIRQLEEQEGGHLPIIAVTAYAMKGDRELVLEAGMDDYLTKPIDEKLLLQMIGRHARVAESSVAADVAETSNGASESPVS